MVPGLVVVVVVVLVLLFCSLRDSAMIDLMEVGEGLVRSDLTEVVTFDWLARSYLTGVVTFGWPATR